MMRVLHETQAQPSDTALRGRMAIAATHSALFSRWESREPVPEQEPLPPVRSPQVQVIGSYRVLLPSPGADHEHVVGLYSDYPPELIDQVRVRVALWCGMDIPGVRAGVEGTFLLSVNHHVTRLKTGGHVVLPDS